MCNRTVYKASYFHSRVSPPAKNLISCSFVPSAKGQTEHENFQRLDQQNKFLQRRMIVKNNFYVKIFRRREKMEWKTALTRTGGVAGAVVRVSAFHLLDRGFVFLVPTHAKRVRQRSADSRGFCPGALVSSHRRVRYCGLEFAPSIVAMPRDQT